MTRSTPVVSTPTPGALAVIKEPAKDPSFVLREVNLGVMVSPFATIAPPAGAPAAKYILIPVSIGLVISVSANTAYVAVFDFVPCFYVPTHSSVAEVSPLKPVPSTTTSCVLEASSNRELIAVTVGTAEVKVYPQMLGEQVASSAAFKNVTKVAFSLFFLTKPSRTLQVICVEVVETTKQSTDPTPPLKESCTGLSVFLVPKLVPVIVIKVPPYIEPTLGEIAVTVEPTVSSSPDVSIRPSFLCLIDTA